MPVLAMLSVAGSLEIWAVSSSGMQPGEEEDVARMSDPAGEQGNQNEGVCPFFFFFFSLALASQIPHVQVM